MGSVILCMPFSCFSIAFSHFFFVCMCVSLVVIWICFDPFFRCCASSFSFSARFLLCAWVLFCSFYFPFKQAFRFIKTYTMIKINKKRASICVRERCACAKCLLWSWAFSMSAFHCLERYAHFFRTCSIAELMYFIPENYLLMMGKKQKNSIHFQTIFYFVVFFNDPFIQVTNVYVSRV